MSTTIPTHVREMKLGDRMRWARKRAGLSHDRLVEKIGRSNRSYLIKIERGDHIPRRDLRDAIADATGVPRDLFATEEDEEADQLPHVLLERAMRIIARQEARAELAAARA